MALQSLDVKQRSASTTTPPGVRETLEVAKLIDVSKCIGCKACQAACQEWNDLREPVGTNYGLYQNPIDLTEHSSRRATSFTTLAPANANASAAS